MEKDKRLPARATQLNGTGDEPDVEAATGTIWNKIAIIGFAVILLSTLVVLIFANIPSDQPSEVPSIPVNK